MFAWEEMSIQQRLFWVPTAVDSYYSSFLKHDASEKLLCNGEGDELRLCGPREDISVNHG